MTIQVKVKTSSKEVKVIKSENVYNISLKGKPHCNIANLELIDVISKYFNIPKSYIKIVRGLKSKQKVIHIDED